MRFLGLELEDAVFDATTLGLHRAALAAAGAMEEPFDLFDRFLKNKGYLARASAGCKRFSPEGIKEKREGREGEGSIRFRHAKRAGNAAGGGRIIDATRSPRSWRRKSNTP
jgi:hypothetical protein